MADRKANHHRLPAHVTPLRYKLLIKPDLDNFTFYGEENIEVDIAKPTKEIVLHSAELEIDKAEVLHGKQEVLGKVSYNEKAETVTLSFPRAVPKGKGVLKIIFRGILNDRMRGFYRSKYVVDGQEKVLATTQFEAVDARRAFPSFDEPAHKAIFDITFMIPAHLTAISNTLPTTVSEHEGGIKRVEFAPTPRMSTYLVAFIIGEFEFIEGKTKNGTLVRIFTTFGKKHQGKFALDVAIKTLEFYEDYFKIAYPLPVLDLIAIPDFAAGAMENWGAVTYRESTLLIDEERSSSANKQWVALVIAHELAHQWFGNLVTMEWWTHLWLNEGFASYIEYLAIDHLFPEWDIWTQFVFLEQGTALKLDALANTHPIEVEVGHPDEINEIFDKVSYSKGASVIRMLADYLGPEDFRKGLSHYLKKHNYANAETGDLWAALSHVSGRNVGRIMANWTGKPGYPLVMLGGGKKGVTLTQSRFFSSRISRKKSKDTTVWQIPVTISQKNSKKRHLLDKKSQSIRSKITKVNADEAGFMRVGYPPSIQAKLEKEISAKKLPAIDRLGIIRDAFALAEAGFMPTADALTLVRSYKEEKEYVIWMEIASSLRQIANLIAYEDFYPQYEAFCRKLFSSIAKHVGWEKKQGEKHTQALLRTLVLYSIGSYGDKQTIERAKKLFVKMEKGETIDSDLRSVVYNLVAENGGEHEHKKFIEFYKKEELQQEKDRIGRSLGSFRQKDLLKKTLEFSLSKDVRPQSVNGIITSVWGSPFGRDLTWEFVKEHWSTLEKRFSGGHLLSRLLSAASDFTTKEKVADFETFFKKHPVPEATRTIAQVLEQIYANEAWLAADKEELALNFSQQS